MKFLWFDRRVLDTDTMPIRELFSLVFFLEKRSNSKGFVDYNGPSALERFARGVQVRLLKDRPAYVHQGYIWHVLKKLAPPPCRCGRKGTRIIGQETFCETCGPTTQALHRMKWKRDLNDRESQEIGRVHKEQDYRDLQGKRRTHQRRQMTKPKDTY